MKEMSREEFLIYVKSAEHAELGEVKRENNDGSGYFVRYHMGDTAANTPKELLVPITNAYAFQIIRKDVNNEIQTQKARQIANRIIETVMPRLTGEKYYEAEDAITEIIENYKEENSHGY